MADLNSLVERLSSLSVLEAAELSRLLEEHWGVSASAPVVVGPAVVPTIVEVKEEPTEFNVKLITVAADKRITVIKEVRSITGLGLKEAKEFTEQAVKDPKVLKEAVGKDEAERIKRAIEDAGGTVEIAAA